MRKCFDLHCKEGWYVFAPHEEGYLDGDYKGGITGEMEKCTTCNGTGLVEDYCYCHAYCSCECMCGVWDDVECICRG